MIREQSIPLFLWVAAALVAHAIFGEGATKVELALEETQDISSFARSVRRQASLSGKPFEVSMIEEDPAEPQPDEVEIEPEQAEEKKPEAQRPEEKKPEPVKKPEEKKPEPKKPEPVKKPEEKKPELLAEKKPPAPAVPPPSGRIAVQQHAKPDQEDNPNARFMAEQANHTDEETRARVTSTDQNAEQPSPGGNFQGAEKEPGNSDEQRVAQSDESKGEKGVPPDAATPSPNVKAEKASATPPPAQGAQAAARTAQAPPPASQTAQSARAAQAERAAALEAMTANQGRWSMPPAQNAQGAQAGRKKLPEQRAPKPTDLLGYGSTAVTARGVNLNLTPSMVVSVVGADRLAMERRRVGERRLSQHRGSWKSQGLEKWRPALENYVASVKPGNQTNLNTAHAPFARYLNEIHNRIHPVFADDFLSHLARLPGTDPLNNPDMSTHLEVQLSGADGRVMRLGITKSSGMTAFDIGALDAVERAGPYGVPPAAILSSDGNVYLHWEFHRRPELACSTYFARPYILNLTPKTAPPQVEPPAPPTYDAPHPDQRTGARDPVSQDPAPQDPAGAGHDRAAPAPPG